MSYEVPCPSSINAGANLSRSAAISRQVQIPGHVVELMKHDGLSSQDFRLYYVIKHKAIEVRLDPYVHKAKPILFALSRPQS